MTSSRITGRATVVGDYVSGDVILPARYAFLDADSMAAHVLEALDPEANMRVRSRPLLVAGMGFGYGTGRESCARALRAAGVRAVIGGPFARMFYRNAINNGLLVVDCPDIIADGVPEDEEIVLDINAGEIRCAGRTYTFPPLPDIVRRIVEAGDLIEFGRRLFAAGPGDRNG